MLPLASWFYHTESGFTSIAISSDGNYIVAGHINHNLYFFEKSRSEPVWTCEANLEVKSVAISSDGNYIVAGSRDKRVYLFNKASSTPIWINTTGSDVCSVAISSDGNYIVAGCEDGEIYFFDRSSSTPLWNSSAGIVVETLAISSDGNYFVAGSDNGIYWFNKTSSLPEQNYALTQKAASVAISSNGNYIVAGSWDDNVYLFERSSSTPMWIHSAYDQIISVDISSDGRYIAAGGKDEHVYFFQNSSSTPLWDYKTNTEIMSVSLCLNGDYVAVGGIEITYCFHKSEQNPLWSQSEINSGGYVAISADCNYIATALANKLYLIDRSIPTQAISLGYYTRLIGLIGLIILAIVGVIYIVKRRKLKVRGIRVFISHAVDDFNKYRIGEIAKYLESYPEINHVYFCEEDLTGNIDDWMKKTVPRCQLLIFFSTENSLNSEDCMNELKIARKLNIEITPVLGVNLRWEDLENLNINRELGQEFDPMEFDKFKENIYNYIIKFAHDLEKEIIEKTRSKGKIKK